MNLYAHVYVYVYVYVYAYVYVNIYIYIYMIALSTSPKRVLVRFGQALTCGLSRFPAVPCDLTGTTSCQPMRASMAGNHKNMGMFQIPYITLRVQRTQIWSMYGFFFRDRKYGFGYIPSVWVLGPLG